MFTFFHINQHSSAAKVHTGDEPIVKAFVARFARGTADFTLTVANLGRQSLGKFGGDTQVVLSRISLMTPVRGT